MGDGTRKVIPGSYTLWAGGHRPQDEEGNNGTSGACLSAKLQLTAYM